MIEMILQWFTFPVRLMSGGAQLFTNALQGASGAAGTLLQPAASAATGLGAASSGLAQSAAGAVASAVQNVSNWTKEVTDVSDTDLSGDDLKLVNYSILFTKRDYESVLLADQEDLVDYSTNGASWAAIQLSQYTAATLEGRLQPPRDLVSKGYRVERIGNGWTFQEEDRRYVQIQFKVVQRLSRQSADYDKQQVKALQSIDRSLQKIAATFGP